ncbi:unnamed protein product [Prorocentrum cordatum]|uniref:Uncharacterized protein n=1 Tax=Prorocentrum cordatum TaxID=2364126 RepID=A0ABN9USM3_9DINO|nr:unnamed protein product [Polarella glacialis]
MTRRDEACGLTPQGGWAISFNREAALAGAPAAHHLSREVGRLRCRGWGPGRAPNARGQPDAVAAHGTEGYELKSWCVRCGAFGSARARPYLFSVCHVGPRNRHAEESLKMLKRGVDPSTKKYVGRSVPLVWQQSGWASKEA